MIATVSGLIARNADERFKPSLELLENDGQQTDNKARNSCVRRVVKELGPILAAIKSTLGPVDEKLLARVNAAVDGYWASAAQTERKFIAEILADRESDAPRLVYADWLTERGHPRGELIVLQCAQRAGTATDKQRARIRRSRPALPASNGWRDASTASPSPGWRGRACRSCAAAWASSSSGSAR